jgi:beta-glucanase (GH16 family)
MKSILKTFNAGFISNFALIGILCALTTACGSGADSNDPRRFDTTGPEIILNTSPEVTDTDGNVVIDINQEYVELGAVVRDLWDINNLADQDAGTEGVQPFLIEGTVDNTKVGSNTLYYSATDSSGNKSEVKERVVEVKDLSGPVIKFNNSEGELANPLPLALNSTFTLPILTALDVGEGEITNAKITSNDVDASNVGTYSVVASASDSVGNTTEVTLTVIVEPVYQDEVVIFRNGSISDAWQPGLNGYDQDLNWGACPAGDCPNLEFGFVNDTEKGGDVVYVSHADTPAQAGFFIETGTPNDLRGAEVNGKLQFDIWSESGVDVFVSADCMYPCQGGPVSLPNVGVGEWQTISIPASQMMTQGLNSITMENVSTFSIFSDGWTAATFRLDNISWLCEFSCTGTDQPDKVYTPWDKADPAVGYDAPASYEGYDLVWSDEFDGAEVDTAKWKLINAGGGFGNFERQYYREQNASIDTDNDLLVISAEIQKNADEALPGNELYSSAKLTTQDLFEFKHGRVDIRAVVAEGKGMWSAGWMLGANVDDLGWPYSGEIDIVDTIGGQLNGIPQEGMVVHNVYWNSKGPDNSEAYEESYYNQSANGERRINETNNGVTFSNQFHVFSIEWDENKIRFFIDGEYVEGSGKDLKLSGGAPCPGFDSGRSCVGETFNQDFFLILNVAVGGDWPEDPDETTQFPRGMLVDYVRVYQTPAQQAAQ